MKILRLTFLLITSTVFSQAPTIDWQKAFGGSGDDSGYAILSTSDNYLLVGGSTNSSDGDITENLGGYDAWIVKYNTEGNEIWKKSYGGSDWDVIWDLKETSDGNYIFFAISASEDGQVGNNIGETDFWIVKINTSGEIIWEKNYGGSGLEDGGEILQTPDDGYVIIGYSSSSDGDFPENNGDFDYAIMKINGNGEPEWSKSFGGSEMDLAINGIIDNEGNILITGYSYSNDGDFSTNKGNSDVWVMKLNPEGNLIWKKNIGGSEFDQSYCINQLQNGNYIVGINSPSNDVDFDDNYGNSDIWLFYLDSNGNILNKHHFGGSSSEAPLALKPLPNGNVVVSSVSYSSNGDISNNHGSADFWIMKIDESGEIIWESSFGGSGLDRLWGMAEFDNGYAAVGETESNDSDVTGNHGGYDFWTLKLNPENMGINDNVFANLNIYPNPASDRIYIQSENKIDLIELYDLSGKLILKSSPDKILNALDISDLSRGTYILKIKMKGQVYTKKIIKK